MADEYQANRGRHRITVTFDCPGAMPLFDRSSTAGIGGAEVRAATFAKFLAQDLRFRVRFVVGATGFVARDSRTSVELCCEATNCGGSLPRYRLTDQVSRWTAKAAVSLSKHALRRPPSRAFFRSHQTDVLCCFGVTNRTASLVRTARQAGYKAIVFLTSDRTLEDMRRVGRNDRGLYGERGEWCRYSLQHADAVVVQKEAQRSALKQFLGIRSDLIRNPIDLDSKHHEPGDASGHVLWVGRADVNSKRADLLLEVARRCPRVSFVAIMNVHNQTLYQALRQECPDNLRIIEHVPFERVEAYFSQAAALLNTSNAEGFPNSFLQSAKYGVPIISLNVDPDSMIERHTLGRYCRGRLENAVQAVQEVGRSTGAGRRFRRQLQDYVREYHSVHDRVRDLQCVVARVLDSVDMDPSDASRRELIRPLAA